MKNIHFEAGTSILKEGDEGDTAFIIIDGTVEVIVGQDSEAKVVSTLEAGEVFGEMSLIEPGPRSASVKAVTDTVCTVTNYEDFMQSLKDDPEKGMQFMKTLVLRLRQMNTMITSMDPKRRGFRQILKEWIMQPHPMDDVSQSEREAMMHYIITNPWIY